VHWFLRQIQYLAETSATSCAPIRPLGFTAGSELDCSDLLEMEGMYTQFMAPASTRQQLHDSTILAQVLYVILLAMI
jgi:hypothetical protein